MTLEGINFKSETLPEDPFKGKDILRDYLGEVVACGFVEPPQWWVEDQTFYAQKFNRPTPIIPDTLFVCAISPLGWEYDTDHNSFLWNRLQNCEHIYWLEYKDRETGKPKYRNSQFADVRTAFAKLGYQINDSTDAAKLVGKKFVITVVEKRYNKTQTAPTELHLPFEERPDYVFGGTKKVIKRPKPKADNTPPTEAIDQGELSTAVAELVTALDGVSTDDFFPIVSKMSVNGKIKELLVGEAVNDDGAKLVSRLVRAGMRFEDGRLVAP